MVNERIGFKRQSMLLYWLVLIKNCECQFSIMREIDRMRDTMIIFPYSVFREISSDSLLRHKHHRMTFPIL